MSKSFDGKSVLEDVSFRVDAGDVVGVLGKNGAGKTTLLELMLGFTPATAGKVEVFGHDSYRLPGSIKSRIGFVPQQDELIDQLSARDQLHITRSFYRQWDDELMDRLVRSWDIDESARALSMSVGQRQKLSILLALGHRPDLLILDEPVASLDPLACRAFLEQIVEIAADGDRAVVLSSHIVSDIERLANKIWILKDNGLYWGGDFDELKDTVVRLHLHSLSRLSSTISIPNALSVDISDAYATAVVCAFTRELESEIAELTGARLEIESLTLEDIFLEMHR
ncbi:MAG TPA: ABC transporter ATP-binding protein [Gammaproteobacteria bacterium]|nr:ABC transporter ATP-binding protein [Gammaproteobacteria bacterium]